MKTQERSRRQGTSTVDDMRATVRETYGGPEVMRLEQAPRPAAVKGDGVLVRVRAAGVDRGVWHMMTGLPHLGRLAFGSGNRRTGFWAWILLES